MATIVGQRYYRTINRLVIRVCHNPLAPEWVLSDGTAAPAALTGDTEQAKEPGRILSPLCRSNWRMTEHIFTGSELMVRDDPSDPGTERPKTRDEIIAEIRRAMRPAATGPAPESTIGVVL